MTSPGQRELYTRAPFRGFLKDPDTDKASWSVIQSEKSEIQNCLRCQSVLWHVSIYEMSCSEHGGLIPCAGGNYRINKKQQAVRALSWKQVDQISETFAALNPYDRKAVPGSILKIEKDNYDSSKNRHQLYCVAISAKRYVLFLWDGKSDPILVRWSEHGLGHLLNPIDPENTDRDWIKQVWGHYSSESAEPSD